MEYNPSAFLRASPDSTNPNSNPPSADLIILNQPLRDFPTFKTIWSHTHHHICADGGANRLYVMLSNAPKDQRAQFLPDLIHGDLDSLESSVSAFYAERGVTISQDEDQYSTDFGKCMKLITNGYGPEAGYAALTTPSSGRNSTPHEIIILSTLAGRVDQGLGLLHELLRETLKERAEGVSPVRLWLLSEQSISFLLQPGTSNIRGLDSADGIFTPNVGILPIYGAATISTKGMEWDVQEWKTEMGGMVSTSNHVLGNEVEVVTDHVVLFTVERVRKDRG